MLFWPQLLRDAEENEKRTNGPKRMRERDVKDPPVCHHGKPILVGEDDVHDGATTAAAFLLTPPVRKRDNMSDVE